MPTPNHPVEKDPLLGMEINEMTEEEYEEWLEDQELQNEEAEEWDEDEFDGDYDWENDPAGRIPDGCRACGGPYPDCLDSCPMGERDDY